MSFNELSEDERKVLFKEYLDYIIESQTVTEGMSTLNVDSKDIEKMRIIKLKKSNDNK